MSVLFFSLNHAWIGSGLDPGSYSTASGHLVLAGKGPNREANHSPVPTAEIMRNKGSQFRVIRVIDLSEAWNFVCLTQVTPTLCSVQLLTF